MKKLLKLGAIAVAALSASAPAMAEPDSGDCVTYSVRVCITYDTYGYSSLKDCRLNEYARCMAGEPPVDEYAYKGETITADRVLAA